MIENTLIPTIPISSVELDGMILYSYGSNPKPMAHQVKDTPTIFLRERSHIGNISLLNHLGIDPLDTKNRVWVSHNFDDSIRTFLYYAYDNMENVRKTCESYRGDNYKELEFRFFDFKSQKDYPVVSIQFPLRKTKKTIQIQVSKTETKWVSISEGNLIQEL